MRVLVINTNDIVGGSAIAAYRLCKGLELFYNNVEFYFVVGNKRGNDSNVFCTRKKMREFWTERLLDKYTNKLGLQYFWFPYSSKSILYHVKKLAPDIIYLRNIHGGFFKTSLITKLSILAPIVWTLSDMWSFTGHCAHSFGDMSWKYMESGCPDLSIYPAIGINTGKWLLKRKQKIYKNANITIVTPSKWLFNLAKQSPVFNNKDLYQIYNGFDLDLFKPKDKSSCRVALNIPPKSKVIMFSAEYLSKSNPWKGGTDLIHIMKNISQNTNEMIHLLITGEGNLNDLYAFDNIVVHKIGYIQNDIFMATCYSASDLLIYPTRADNLPNVLIEAISCGTPCITFDVGGCKEIITNGTNGFVVDCFDINLFSRRVIEMLKNRLKQQIFAANARQSAENKFTLKKMCCSYYNLFKMTADKYSTHFIQT